jgi:hypothetical protein
MDVIALQRTGTPGCGIGITTDGRAGLLINCDPGY